jgi:hypothetical protein
MNTFISPKGNPEVWEEKPEGYFTPEEWDALHPAPVPEPPTLAEAKEAKLAEIAAARFGEETGGVVFQNITIDTSRESQGLITGAALQATIDSAYVCRWKTPSGFVELTSAMILAVAVAVRVHVQACFDREAELILKVEAATSVDEVSAITWPTAV